MADVRPSGGDIRGSDHDRGQLLLVAALGLAVLFVTLALTLNTAIYTENLATRGSDLAGGGDALQYRAASHHATLELIVRSNAEHNDSYTTLERNLSSGIEDWNSLSGRHEAASAAAADTTLIASNNGTRIRQSVQRNFTDDDANPSWTLAEDVSGTRAYRMNVSKASLRDPGVLGLFGGSVFNVTFDSGGDRWKLSVYKETGIPTEARVEVVHDSQSFGPCTSDESFVHINVTEETVDGTDCPELGYLDNVSAPYDISYEHTVEGGSDTVNGTYDLIVDKKNVGPTPDPYVADPLDGPSTSPVIYNATTRVVYNTTRLDYVLETGVTPGETLDS